MMHDLTMSNAHPSNIDHPFYSMLDGVLTEAGFDGFVDHLGTNAAPGAKVRPAAYFRMLLVGYFEDIDSQRGIAWRCRDSRSLAEFLHCVPEAVPGHRCLAEMTRQLPAEAHEQAFEFALKLVAEKKLFDVPTLLAEAHYREANAAMRAIRRLEVLGDYKRFLLHLAQEAAIENPPDDNTHVFARSEPAPGQSFQANGRTHLPDKSEHVIDLKRPVTTGPGGRPPLDSRPDVVPDVSKAGATGDLPGWAADRDAGHVLALVAGSFILGCGIVAVFGTFNGVAVGSVFVFLLLLLFLVGRVGWLTFLWWTDRN